MILTSQFESALNDLTSHIRELLVAVGSEHRGVGSGVIVGSGWVLTNNHVAGDGRGLQVELNDGSTYPAQVIKRKPDVDLALLQIKSNHHTAAVFASESPRPGEMVFAFGHPWGQRNVLTGGVISALTSVRTRHGEIPVVRSDVQLAPGNSGGPLLNAAGEVLGLNTLIFGGDQSVSISASVLREFLEEARKTLPQASGAGDVI